MFYAQIQAAIRRSLSEIFPTSCLILGFRAALADGTIRFASEQIVNADVPQTFNVIKAITKRRSLTCKVAASGIRKPPDDERYNRVPKIHQKIVKLRNKHKQITSDYFQKANFVACLLPRGQIEKLRRG